MLFPSGRVRIGLLLIVRWALAGQALLGLGLLQLAAAAWAGMPVSLRWPPTSSGFLEAFWSICGGRTCAEVYDPSVSCSRTITTAQHPGIPTPDTQVLTLGTRPVDSSFDSPQWLE